jgi:predicted transcriptional regulator of viral defense system
VDNAVSALLNQGNGLFLTSTAEQVGIQRWRLSALVKEGLLERSDRGVYIEVGGLDDTLFSMQQRAKKLVYSHETALFFHGLTDHTPLRYSITVPASYKPSGAIKSACKIFYVKEDLIGLGKKEMPSGMGHQITSYDIERTLCDIVRSRNKLDHQIFIEALKGYARRQDKNLDRLAEYAKQFGVLQLLRQYLEVLL